MSHYHHSFLHFPRIFPRGTKQEIRELMLATMVVDFAAATVMLFEPIYLWNLGFSLQAILLYWAMVYGAYSILMPLGAKFASRFGYEHSILVGTVWLIVYFIALYSIQRFPTMIYATPILYAIQKTFYWPAFNADFAQYVGRKIEGRLVSTMQILTSLVAIAGPLFGSMIVEAFGFGWFFVCMGSVMILSNWVTLRTREKHTPESYEYAYTWKRFFTAKGLRQSLAYIGFGEELIMLGVWPVFIFVMVKDVFSTGVVASFATLITVMLLYSVGRATDAKNKTNVLRLGVVMYAISWVARSFVSTGLQAFLGDSFGRFSKSVVHVPLMAITYDNAKNHTIMHTMMFFEGGLALGKFIAACLGLLIVSLLPQELGFQAIFFLAGGMTMLYALLQRQK